MNEPSKNLNEEQNKAPELITRRRAISRVGVAAGAAVVGLAVGGAAGYFAGTSAAPSAAPSAVPSTVTSTVTSTISGSSAATGPKLKMVFVTGNFGSPFDVPIVQGFNDACTIWNVDGTFTGPTTGDYPSIVNAIYAAISTKPDGLIVPLMDATFYPPMRQAMSQGIACMASNALATPLPDPTWKPQPYYAYVGADDTLAGIAAANEVAGLRTWGPDDVAVVVQDNMGMASGDARAAAMLAQLKKLGIKTDLTGQTGSMGQSGEIVANLTGAYYVGHPNTKALMGTSGNAWGIGSFIKSQGLAGKVVGGGWDLTPECLQYISDGVMSYTVDQKPYFQGFYPVYEIWKFITSGGAYSPCGVNTGGGIVDSSNVAAILKNRPTG